MSQSEGVIWCDGCGVEITWAPYKIDPAKIVDKTDYCCEDCSLGLVCSCSERMEMDNGRRESTEPFLD